MIVELFEHHAFEPTEVEKVSGPEDAAHVVRRWLGLPDDPTINGEMAAWIVGLLECRSRTGDIMLPKGRTEIRRRASVHR